MRRKLGLGCLGGVVVVLAGLGTLAYLLFVRVPGEYFDSNGVRIHYTVEGAGEPLILIHGLAANADLNWRRAGINALLRKDFQVIAFDCRGHGLSDKPHEKEQYGPEMVHDVTRLMDHLKIEKAHVAGYSMGGFIALELAMRYPERVRSVALCASGWKDPNGGGDFSSAYRAPSKEVQEFVPVFKPAAANAVQAIADAPIAVDLPPRRATGAAAGQGRWRAAGKEREATEDLVHRDVGPSSGLHRSADDRRAGAQCVEG
jgi:pimeloyl-ACP methyl ester carboxylesterase